MSGTVVQKDVQRDVKSRVTQPRVSIDKDQKKKNRRYSFDRRQLKKAGPEQSRTDEGGLAGTIASKREGGRRKVEGPNQRVRPMRRLGAS